MSDAFGQPDQPTSTTPGWPPAPAPAAPTYPAASAPGYPAPPAAAVYPPAPVYQPAQQQAYPPAPAPYAGYQQPGAYGPHQPAGSFVGEKPKNGLATWALVVGVVVVGVLAFSGYAIASLLAILLSVRAIQRANQIKRGGYPQAVGMTRALVGLAFAVIGLVFYVLAMAS